MSCVLFARENQKEKQMGKSEFARKISSTHYMYMYVVESKLGPKITFPESKLGPNFLSFFIQNFFCRDNEIFKNIWKKKNKHYPVFESKLGPIMLRNMLGLSFDSTLGQVLTQPYFLAFGGYAETTIFIMFSAKICIFKAHPPQNH